MVMIVKGLHAAHTCACAIHIIAVKKCIRYLISRGSTLRESDHFQNLASLCYSVKMQSLGTKMATKAIEKSVKKELKSALPQAPSGARLRSKTST